MKKGHFLRTVTAGRWLALLLVGSGLFILLSCGSDPEREESLVGWIKKKVSDVKSDGVVGLAGMQDDRDYQLKKQLQYYRTAVQENDQDVDAWIGLALSANVAVKISTMHTSGSELWRPHREALAREADEAISKAMQLGPRDPNVWIAKARICRDDTSCVQECYEKIRAIDPSSPKLGEFALRDGAVVGMR
ncbi:hypothetical protein KJ965_05580 [Patescibacteria group bacterium]|nr:hypothetical protein [Patescibacteria group bacterium]